MAAAGLFWGRARRAGRRAGRRPGRHWRALAAPALLVAQALGTVAGPAGSGWAVLPTPNPTGSLTSVLQSVSCSDASSCTAVGVQGGSTPATLGERWDGHQWVIQPLPQHVTALYGVSCPGSRDCIAVGGTGRVLVERWDGSQWADVPAPTPPDATEASLSGLSCTSARHCVAAGFSSRRGDQRQLAELWDGRRWAIQPTPSPRGQGDFSSVSCSGERCMAVGNYLLRSGDDRAFAELWSHAAWQLQQPVSPPGGVSLLLSVSCSSPAWCMAVGYHGHRILAERWDGTGWAVLPVPSPSGLGPAGDVLVGVSCKSRSWCLAVGRYDHGHAVRALAERWDGTRWIIDAAASPSPRDDELLSVACLRSSCTAVGEQTTAGGQTLTLAERGN